MLNKQFPLRGRNGHVELNSSNNSQGRRLMAMVAPTRVSGRHPPPGKDYMIWNGRDVLGALPSELWEVVQRGCWWTGVGEDYIYQLVEKYEERLAGWWRRVGDESV